MISRGLIMSLILIVQVFCALFFLLTILSSVLGFAPINWQVSEFIELGAALGLLIGVALTATVLYRTLKRNRHVEGQLRTASGAFMELLYERFDEWGLTRRFEGCLKVRSRHKPTRFTARPMCQGDRSYSASSSKT